MWQCLLSFYWPSKWGVNHFYRLRTFRRYQVMIATSSLHQTFTFFFPPPPPPPPPPPHIPLIHQENLFGNYYEKGDLIARKYMDSVEEQDQPLTSSNRYVLADIASFFTLLVGIYFPSVTGETSCVLLTLLFGVRVLHPDGNCRSMSF